MGLFGIGRKSQVRRLACRDAGMNCDAVITGKTDEEVLRQATEQAQKAHGMKPSEQRAVNLLKKLIKNA